MKIILYLSNLIIPIVIFYVILSGLFAKIDVYQEFTEGIKDGFQIVIQIAPTIVALFMAVAVLRASETLTYISDFLEPILGKIGFPTELVPLSIVRMFSSSAATGLLLDICKNSGVDSFSGRAASIMMSCTETIFYTMSVYFVVVKVTKTRYTLDGALLASFSGITASVVIASFM